MATRGGSTPRRRRGRAAPGPLTDVALVLPLLLFYEVGILFTDTINGTDIVTRTLLVVAGRSGFLWAQLVLVLATLGALLYLRRRERLDASRVLPVILESAIYALTMGTFIIFVMVDILGLSPALATEPQGVAGRGIFERVVLSIGAGVHEELVFRVILLGGLAWAFRRLFGLGPRAAFVAAVALSSLIFSAAHHVGPLGEPLRAGVFVYRTLAGVVFAVIYRYRRFAVAVYTHAFYDIYVLLLR